MRLPLNGWQNFVVVLRAGTIQGETPGPEAIRNLPDTASSRQFLRLTAAVCVLLQAAMLQKGGRGMRGSGLTPSSCSCRLAVLDNFGFPILTLKTILAPTSISTTKTMAPWD